MVDCLNHMWLKSDPVLRKYKRVPKTRPKKSDATTTSAKNPDDILLESFIIEWNRINWLLKLFVMNFGLNGFENCLNMHAKSLNLSKKMGPIFESEKTFVYRIRQTVNSIKWDRKT